MPENEKIIRYKVVVAPPDAEATLKAQRAINERLRQDARTERPQPQGTQGQPAAAQGATPPAQAGGQPPPTPTGGQGAPPPPQPPQAPPRPNWQWWRPQRSRPAAQQATAAARQPVQPATGSVFADFFKKLQDALRSNIGLGPNTVFGQYLRGVGFGGTGAAGSFARYTAGNINFAQVARLIPIMRQGSPALAGAARGMLGQMVGGAAIRGVGGAVLGAPGAALAGAGPIGLMVGAAILGVKNIVTALKEASQAVSHFTSALYSGDASQALKGLVSYSQSVVRLIGGPIIGALMSKIVGIGHTFIDAMDGLISKFGRWSPIVLAQQARYQVMQMLYERKLALALEPLMNAWMQIKLKVLDGLARIADALITAGKVTWKFVQAGLEFTKFLLRVTGLATVFEVLRNTAGYLVDAFKHGALFILSASKMVFDWMASHHVPGAAKMSKAINELINAITKKTPALSDSLKSLVTSFFGLNRFRGLQQHGGPGDMQPREDARRRGIVPTDETPTHKIPGGIIQAVPPMDQSQGPGKRIITPSTTQPATPNTAQPSPPTTQPNLPSGQRRIPAMAEGGIVRRPTIALIGEKEPEAVIPLHMAVGLHFNPPHRDTARGNANAFMLPPSLPTISDVQQGHKQAPQHLPPLPFPTIEHKPEQSIRDKALLQQWASPYYSMPRDPGLQSMLEQKAKEPKREPGIYMRLPGFDWTRMYAQDRKTPSGYINAGEGRTPVPIKNQPVTQGMIPAPVKQPVTFPPPLLPMARETNKSMTVTHAGKPQTFWQWMWSDPYQKSPAQQLPTKPALPPATQPADSPWWADGKVVAPQQASPNLPSEGSARGDSGSIPARARQIDPLPAAPSQQGVKTYRSPSKEEDRGSIAPSGKVVSPSSPSRVQVTEDRSGTKPQLGVPMELDNNRHEQLEQVMNRLMEHDDNCADDESAMLLTMMKGHMFARGM